MKRHNTKDLKLNPVLMDFVLASVYYQYVRPYTSGDDYL